MVFGIFFNGDANIPPIFWLPSKTKGAIAYKFASAWRDSMINSNPILIETENSIYEYDSDCLKCKISLNVFIILLCTKYSFSE